MLAEDTKQGVSTRDEDALRRNKTKYNKPVRQLWERLWSLLIIVPSFVGPARFLPMPPFAPCWHECWHRRLPFQPQDIATARLDVKERAAYHAAGYTVHYYIAHYRTALCCTIAIRRALGWSLSRRSA